MILSLIAAASTNNVIGRNNQLVWHLPNDMRFFKNTTWGMPVIMGRKTYASLEDGILPGRFNFVVTRHVPAVSPSSGLRFCASVGEAIAMAKETDCKEAFVIGGAQIYSETIGLADRIYLTRVHREFEGDAYFPPIDDNRWTMQSSVDFLPDQKHAYAYSFQLWVKRDKNPQGTS
jgi:dihydrofolate reductase